MISYILIYLCIRGTLQIGLCDHDVNSTSHYIWNNMQNHFTPQSEDDIKVSLSHLYSLTSNSPVQSVQIAKANPTILFSVLNCSILPSYCEEAFPSLNGNTGMIGLTVNEAVYSNLDAYAYPMQDGTVISGPFPISTMKLRQVLNTLPLEDGWDLPLEAFKMEGSHKKQLISQVYLQSFPPAGRLFFIHNDICPTDGNVQVVFLGWEKIYETETYWVNGTNITNGSFHTQEVQVLLKEGEGHCYSSWDCEPGLRCYDRKDGEPIFGYDFSKVALTESFTAYSRMSVCTDATDENTCEQNMLGRLADIAKLINGKSSPNTLDEMFDLLQSMYDITLGGFNPRSFYIGYSNNDFYQIMNCQFPGTDCDTAAKLRFTNHYAVIINHELFGDDQTHTYKFWFNNTIDRNPQTVYDLKYLATSRPWFNSQNGWGLPYEYSSAKIIGQTFSYALGNVVIGVDAGDVCEVQSDQKYRQSVMPGGCSAEFPCLEGFQYCYSDSHCMAGLVCNSDNACGPKGAEHPTIAITIGWVAVGSLAAIAFVLYSIFCWKNSFNLCSGSGQLFHFVVFWASTSDFATDLTFGLDCLLRERYVFFYICFISMFVTFAFCCWQLLGIIDRWSIHEIKQHWFSTTNGTLFGMFWVLSNGAPGSFHISKLLIGMPVTPVDYHEIASLKTTIFLFENVPSCVVLVWYLVDGEEMTILVVLSFAFTISRIMYSIFQVFQQISNLNGCEVIVRIDWDGPEMVLNRFHAAHNFSKQLRTEHDHRVVCTGLKIGQHKETGSRYFMLAITTSSNILEDHVFKHNADFFKEIHLKNFIENGDTDEEGLSRVRAEVKNIKIFKTMMGGQTFVGAESDEDSDDNNNGPAARRKTNSLYTSEIYQARSPFSRNKSSIIVATTTTRWEDDGLNFRRLSTGRRSGCTPDEGMSFRYRNSTLNDGDYSESDSAPEVAYDKNMNSNALRLRGSNSLHPNDSYDTIAKNNNPSLKLSSNLQQSEDGLPPVKGKEESSKPPSRSVSMNNWDFNATIEQLEESIDKRKPHSKVDIEMQERNPEHGGAHE